MNSDATDKDALKSFFFFSELLAPLACWRSSQPEFVEVFLEWPMFVTRSLLHFGVRTAPEIFLFHFRPTFIFLHLRFSTLPGSSVIVAPR